MGTKNNPGKWDCYSKAEPDEPMFTLLARDPLAALLVEVWASLREIQGCSEHPRRNHDAKIIEARECAKAMREWRSSKE